MSDIYVTIFYADFTLVIKKNSKYCIDLQEHQLTSAMKYYDNRNNEFGATSKVENITVHYLVDCCSNWVLCNSDMSIQYIICFWPKKSGVIGQALHYLLGDSVYVQ